MSHEPLKLRPGLLVCFGTRIEGGIKHERSKVQETRLEDGALLKEWDAKTRIQDPEEFEAVTRLRLEIRNVMKAVTIRTEFALMCPAERAAELQEAIAQIEAMAAGWNAEAKVYQVKVAVVLAEVAENKADAIKAIKDEVVDLMARMEDATRRGSVKEIRAAAAEAAQRAKLLDMGVEGEQDSEIQEAMDIARSIARKIVKRVEKGGENLAAVLEEQNLEPMSAARMRFIARPVGTEEAAK